MKKKAPIHKEILYDDENIEARDPRAAETVGARVEYVKKYQKANGLSEKRDALNAN